MNDKKYPNIDKAMSALDGGLGCLSSFFGFIGMFLLITIVSQKIGDTLFITIVGVGLLLFGIIGIFCSKYGAKDESEKKTGYIASIVFCVLAIVVFLIAFFTSEFWRYR